MIIHPGFQCKVIVFRMARMRFAFAILLSFMLAAPAQALETIYTSLTECQIKAYQEEGAYAELACPAPDGWGVEIIEFDSRSYLILEQAGRSHSLQQQMIDEFSFGSFPAVGKLAEWRMGRHGPEALIVRMHYMKAEKPKSVLFVFDLRGQEPRLKGTTTSNVKARQIADSP